jgi:iron complex outermembrane recepter protein
MELSVRGLPVHKTALFMVVVLGMLGRATPAHGQTGGQLHTSIYDQTGGPLSGVTITIDGPASRVAQTSTEGMLEFGDLPPGDYALTAVLTGFESLRRTVRVQSAETSTVSLTMVIAGLEETVVTAAKVGADEVQAIPMAVTALSGAELTKLAAHGIDQAAAMAPSVTFTQNGTFGQLSIRGIGTNAVNAGSDPSSAVYLDGVYLARPAMVFTELLDIDRIEVLRGPQATLYGRNAVGGAVNLISRPPSNDLETSARVTAGNLNELRGEARVSGALVRDRVLGSVAFARGVRDGYVRDLEHPDHPLGGDDLTAARGQLRVVFGRTADLLVSGDVSDQDGTLLTFNKVLQVKPGFTVDNPSDLHEVRTSTLASSDLLHYGGTARLTWALQPSVTLVSLSAYRRLDNAFLVDADITELQLLATHNDELQHQLSQEVTLSGRHSRLTWLGGVFFFHEDDDQSLRVDQYPARTQVWLDPRVTADSRAAFGQATMGLTARFSATAGLRFTRERKRIDNSGGLYILDEPVSQSSGSGYAFADAIEYTAWTPKFVLDVRLAPQAMAYASAARGFKSGGFNPSSTQPGRGYAPEWAWSYEGGIKTELMADRARLNVAAFHMDYTNLQVQTPIGIGVFDIRNAAAATIQGVEVEANARIGPGLSAGGHLAWLDATYDRYIAVGIGGVIGDVAGNRLNNAPEWSGRIWAEWTGNIGASAMLSLGVEATAQSTVYYTPFNDTIQRQVPYGLLGARTEYGPSHQRWSVGAFARNLTDTDYIMATFGTVPTAYGGRPGRSREIGVQFIIRR